MLAVDFDLPATACIVCIYVIQSFIIILQFILQIFAVHGVKFHCDSLCIVPINRPDEEGSASLDHDMLTLYSLV